MSEVYGKQQGGKTMKRRDFCKALVCSAALAPGLALPRAEAAAKSQTVGRAVPAGNYTMSFRSELSQMDIEHEYYYSDSFFAHTSIQYDHQLALATLGMVTAAFNTWASDAKYWANGDVGRENSLDAAYAKLGFGDVKYRYYDVDVGRAGDFVGWSTARKTITLNGKRTTIVALILRGGGYGGEWVSNLHTGVGTGHAGFVIATGEVLAHLRSYLDAAAKEADLGTLKLWVCGYSRGAAAANLLAARIAKELPAIERKNTFVYTFATPAALTRASYPDYQLDFDNNHNTDGTLRAGWASSNIFNLVSSGDLVPRVMPAEWGYYRNGNDRFLPCTRDPQEQADLDALGAGFGPVALAISQLATKEDTDGVLVRLENFFGSKQTYHDKYEAMLMDMVQAAFTRSEAEVAEGHTLTDEEVEARLRGLGNMRQLDEEKLTKAVHNASAMSRPLLEKLETTDGSVKIDFSVRDKDIHLDFDVPLRVRQAVIPVLAVGLYYGVDSATVSSIARYIFQFMSMKPDSADVVVRAAFCHHFEDYASLMEYYAPSAHGMEGVTRG